MESCAVCGERQSLQQFGLFRCEGVEASCHLTFVLSPKRAGSVNSPRCGCCLATPAPSLLLWGSGAARRTDEALLSDAVPPGHSRPNLPNSLHLPHIRSKQPASTTMPAWMPSSVQPSPSATPSAGWFPHVRVWLVWMGGDVVNWLKSLLSDPVAPH